MKVYIVLHITYESDIVPVYLIFRKLIDARRYFDEIRQDLIVKFGGLNRDDPDDVFVENTELDSVSLTLTEEVLR